VHILSDISLSYVFVAGIPCAQITILNSNIPSSYSMLDFFILEKYKIPLDTANVWLMNTRANDAIKSQNIMKLMTDDLDHALYMGSEINMDGVVLKSSYGIIEPTYIDIRTQIEKGISVLIDTDVEAFYETAYIYRIYYRNEDINGLSIGASSYVYGIHSEDIVDPISNTDYTNYIIQADSQIIKGNGSLYRVNDSDIIVEKGIPAIQVAQRYMGPIEHDKEAARQTALKGASEFIEDTIDDMYSDATELYTSLETTFYNTFALQNGVAEYNFSEFEGIYMSEDTYMDPFLFMGV